MTPILQFEQFLNHEILHLLEDNTYAILQLQGKTVEQSEYVRKKLSLCIYVKNLERLLKQYQQGHYEFFKDLSQLSKFLILFGYRPTFCANLLLYIMEKNIETGYLEDPKNISKFEFQSFSFGELKKFFIHNSKTKLNDHVLIQIEKCDYIHPMSPIENARMINAHHILLEKYFNQREIFEQKDIDCIVDAFNKMNIESTTCHALEAILSNQLKKRKKYNELLSKPTFQQPLVSSKKYLNDKEYKQLLHQVREYYDEYQGKIIQSMDENTVIYIAGLLISLGFSKKELEDFFRANERDNVEKYPNAIAEYNQLYEKLNYYKNHSNIQDQINCIQSYLGEIFICSDDEYQFWKLSIREELQKAKQQIPYAYDYEYELAEQQYQKRCIKKC